jgi:hypothetical protein
MAVGGLGNFWSQAVLDYLLGATAPSLPGTWYAALLSVTPSDTGGGTELSGSGYARIALTNNTTNFPASAVVSGVATKLTGTTITWGPASGSNWLSAVAVGFYDASTGGNLGWWGPLATPITVNVGQSLQVAAGAGVFTEG